MPESRLYCYIDSPLGRILLLGDGQAVSGLFLPNHKGFPDHDAAWRQDASAFAAAREQLAEYFAGSRTTFNVPLAVAGTAFQQRVWKELTEIPFGETISYAELARRVGQPTAMRAVGAANGRNPISIIVPCHRVIGASGKLTGYGGGLDKKAWLLEWERKVASRGQGPWLRAGEIALQEAD